MSSEHSILMFTDWYYPAQRAGGPIQSTKNMVNLLAKTHTIKVVCRSTDWGMKSPMENLELNVWMKQVNGVEIMYLSPDKINLKNIKQIIKENNCKMLYINGIFSFYFSILPLFLSAVYKPVKTFVAARGMLHQSALSVKPLKKQLYLAFARGFGLFQSNSSRTSVLIASNEEERKAIVSALGPNIKPMILGNIPIHPEDCPKQTIVKAPDRLKLIFVGRLSPEKNPLALIAALSHFKASIDVTWVGSYNDEKYFAEFQAALKTLPSNIHSQYIQVIEHLQLLQTISEHHVMVLPSLGENFGHAIYESLACSRPVIIGNNTAWQASDCIMTCDPLSPDELGHKLQAMLVINQAAFDQLAQSSKLFAMEWYLAQNFDKGYLEAFS